MSPVSGLTGSYRHMWTPLDLDPRVLQSLQLQEPNESRTREEGKARRTPLSLPLTLCIQMCAFLGFQGPAVAHSTRALSQSARTCNPPCTSSAARSKVLQPPRASVSPSVKWRHVPATPKVVITNA